VADTLDDVVEQRLKGVPGAPPPTPGGVVDPDLLDTTFEKRLGTLATLGKTTPEQLGPHGRAAWNAGWNLFDAAMLGFGRDVLAGARSEPATIAALKRWNSPEVREALDRAERVRLDIIAAREAWGRENPGMSALTTIVGAAPTSLLGLAGGEAALGMTVGRLANAVAPGLTRFVTGQTPGLMRYPGLAVRGSAEGAASGFETSRLSEGDVGEQMRTGAATGAIVNPLTMPLLRNLVPNTPQWAGALARKMEDLGVSVRSAQKPGADIVTRGIDLLGHGEKNAAQREQFTTALSRTFGQDTAKLDTQAFAKAHQDLDTKYATLTPNLKIASNDTNLIHDLASIDSHAHAELGLVEPTRYAAVNGLLTRVQDEMAAASAAGGDVSGETFRAMTRYGSTLSNAARSPDPNLRHYAGEIIDALHSAMERASPARHVEALRETNQQFKNMLISREIADSASGHVDPTALLRHVERKYGDAGNAGDIGTLALGGHHFLQGEARRATHELSGRGKGVLGLLGAGGAGAGVALMEEHGLGALSHLAHDPIAAALYTLGGAGTYAGVRATGPLVRRGVNPLLPPAVETRNQP
jgi:hypothetical protein